ncbi:DUF554 domain-containing protein [Ornithinibacillus gellani]|uniref:DUF554 domain-containing protein n=1 Tax=Ornithinibacillus gellani TaxID=2293253 RepID=UPI000F483DC5|nr:DUF554 domain-containing protein [Ornithinibacillus gellani]TQS76340.1 DUF554 domain-containing protein [Ornithinibacillus gellani]
MALFGTIINGILIIIGSLLGLFFTKIPDRFKETVMQGIALTVILIGLKMAFETEVIIIVLLSLLSGAIIGELLQVEKAINRFGNWIGSHFKSQQEQFSISEGFVTASLIFVIGAMAILGALDSGIRGDHEVLITKGIIDGFTALVLTTTLGIGVILSAVPVVLYQGIIALLATQIDRLVPLAFLDGFIVELTAVGGIIIVAIGLNLLKVVHIRIGNLLPAILTVIMIYSIYYHFIS